MEKKLTKKELKELEDRQKELRVLRDRTIDALKNYEADINATERYFKINGETEKLDLYGRLKQDEKAKLLKRYEALNFLKPYSEYTKEETDKGLDRAWTFARLMYSTKQEYDNEFLDYEDKILNESIDRDGLLNYEIIWTKEQVRLYVELAKKFGYTKIYYTNSSSGALANITEFVKLGAKIIGTCSRKGYEDAGLIIDITEINLEGGTNNEN